MSTPVYKHVPPHLGSALTALRAQAERAQAEYQAFASEVTPPDHRLVPLPAGEWVWLHVPPKQEDADGG